MSHLEKTFLVIGLALFAALHLSAARMMSAAAQSPEPASIAAMLAHGGD
jgi:hypothetical protein